MAAITDLSDVLALGTGAGLPDIIEFLKSFTIGGASINMSPPQYVSYWLVDGNPGAGSVPPTSPAVPTRTTPGSLRHLNAGAGKQKWLLTCEITTRSSCIQLMLYDRLLHGSGLLGTNTGVQNVGGSITRYAGVQSKGNLILVEIYTQVGATPTTIVANYTDQDGNAAQTKPTTFGGTRFRERASVIILPFADGDNGVRSVESIQLAGSTGTDGDFGVTIARPLITFPVPGDASTTGQGGQTSIKNGMTELPGPVEIVQDACLSLLSYTAGIRIPIIDGSLSMVEK